MRSEFFREARGCGTFERAAHVPASEPFMLQSHALVVILAFCASDPVCYRLFVLQQVHGDLMVAPIDVITAEGETRKFTCSEETGVIDVILPVGEGGSGNFLRLAERRDLSVLCQDQEIVITEQLASGKTWQRPARRLADLAGHETRLSAIGSGNLRTSVRIVKNRDVVDDEAGGVVDPFEGRVPIGTGDFVVYAETHPFAPGPELTGEAALEVRGWPFVKATAADGAERWLIVDLGAGTTVLARDFLPADASLEAKSTTEYSGAEKRLVQHAAH